MSRARLFALGTLLGLGGCSLTPPFHEPSPAPPPQWREESQASPDGRVPSDWWRAFRSPELDALMTRAMAQNFDIAAAVARVEQANAQARISGAALLPNVDANASVERTKETRPSSDSLTDYSLGGQASYEVDFWGKNRSAYNSAKESAIAAAFDREVVRLTTESSVANTYFQVLGLAARIAVAQRNLATAQKLLEGLRQEYAVGTVTTLDVTQQETAAASVAASIPPLLQQQSQALDALAILVGEQPERLSVGTATLDQIASPAVAPGLPSQLLRRRPDVRESEAQLLAANYNVGNARAQFFPDINLTAQGGAESQQLSQLFTPQGLVYDLLASLAQPIFEGGRLRGQLEYSRARYREQLADYSKSVIAAFSDVEDSLAAATRTQQAVDQQQVALDKARAALRMVQEQFRAGTVNVVQVLQIEETLFTQENAAVQARETRLEALVGLYKALGGGWSDRAAPPTPDEFRAVPKPAGAS